MISLQLNTLTILSSLTLLIIIVLIFIGIYQLYHKRQRITANQLIDSSPVITQTSTSFSLNELPTNYKTFVLAKRSRQYSSSDSSYTSTTNPHPFYPFGTVQSQVPKLHPSDSSDIETESSPTSFEYSLVELFRLELIYKLYYSSETNQLTFEIIRLTPMHNLIEQCFSFFICKIRLFINNDKIKKYLSQKTPINEFFSFDIESIHLQKAYLKLHILTQQLEIGQTVLVINQYQHLNKPNEQYNKSIHIYEDRIDMIIRQQTKNANEARALICLVYETDRCLLHVGLIKLLGIQYLLKQAHHRDQIRIKISVMIDGKLISQRKSKFISLINGTSTFSTTFHVDYVSLEKTSICLMIAYRQSLISSTSKPISKIEFSSILFKNQDIFQHWTDTLSAPNRPHVHWHVLEAINDN